MDCSSVVRLFHPTGDLFCFPSFFFDIPNSAINPIPPIFSETHEEYKELCLQALTKLCRKRSSPIASGRPATWASGIIYAVGSCNFLFDRSQPIHMTGQEIAEGIGLSKSTISNKAAEIKKLLKMSQWSSEWVLPSKQEDNPLIWMVSVNGFVMDARSLPLEDQRVCFQKGLIPYVPALKDMLK